MDTLFSLLYQVGLVLIISSCILILFAASVVLLFRRNAGRQEQVQADRFFTGTQTDSQQVLLGTKRA